MEITVKGADRLQKSFTKLAGKVARREVLFKRIGIVVTKEVDSTFKSQSHEGQKWKKLSPNTIAARRKGSGAGTAQALQDTGVMREGFNFKATGEDVRIGTPAPYAVYHEQGTDPFIITPKRPGGRLRFITAGGVVFSRKVRHPGIPQRKMLPSKGRGLTLAVTTTNGYLKDSTKESGLG